MKLIFHIGAGKTGSTSIQRTLKENDALLKKNGIWYLGLMLERVETKIYDWQQASSVVPEFHHLPSKEASLQILEVLNPIIEEAKEKNIHTLIWSNESFLGGKHNFIDAMQELQRNGVKVEIVIYVREYASWMRSAYMQWGIKHKTYSGKLKTFSDWSKSHLPSFYRQMKNILETMPNVVNLRNMNAVGDVVLDFLNFSNINFENIKIFRDNDSLKNEELLLRALFNSKYVEEVLPVRFNNILGRNIMLNSTPKEYLESIMPSVSDLKEITDKTSDDRDEINKLLLEQKQKQLGGEKILVKSSEIDSEKLLMSLVDIVMQQSRRIDKLDKLLAEKMADSKGIK